MKTKLLLFAVVVIFVTSIVAFGRDHERKIHRTEFSSVNKLNYIIAHSNLLDEVNVYGNINADKSISYIMKHSNLLDEVNVYGNESISYITKHSNLLDDVNVYGNRI